jgi:hypothetical protein
MRGQTLDQVLAFESEADAIEAEEEKSPSEQLGL